MFVVAREVSADASVAVTCTFNAPTVALSSYSLRKSGVWRTLVSLPRRPTIAGRQTSPRQVFSLPEDKGLT
jgi:hypothetical protein